MSCLLPALTLLVAIGTLLVAFFIPRKIMVNQLYADLVKEYRSPEMGGAILALFDFFVNECNGDIDAIYDKYKDKYENQIGKYLSSKKEDAIDFSKTLHFQRRLVAHFYYNMALLRYERSFPKLPTEYMKIWFTPNENKLLSIILHMAEPASEVLIKAENIPEPPQDEVHMNQLLYKLYEDVEDMK